MRGLLLAIALAASASAQIVPSTWKPIVTDKWGGLNLLQDSTMIDGDAQTAINVLTDNSFLEKRPGNVRLATILAGFPVQYVTDWVSPSGSRYLVAQASQTIYQTNFSGSPVSLSTIAVNSNLTTVAAFSKLEFADGNRPLWYWNGTTTGTVTDAASGNVAPTCTVIAFKDSRIWCGNLPNGFSVVGNNTNGGGGSTVLISSSGGDGYWSTPSNYTLVDNVANRFDFNPDDGESINCLANTPWGMYVGKRNSSYIIKGNGNLSYTPLLLDPKIGCVDNRSVQMVYGVLQWLAVDGVYGYDGEGSPHLLTRELDPLMQTVREATFSQGAWATQLKSDWSSGSESTTTLSLPALPWDYTTLPGQIFPSSATMYDDNTSPALQNCTTAINPANSLAWSCGVGFSSDTLINIDTTSVPLSVGYAQISPSTSGVQVWLSSFTAGNYTTIATTWTLASGAALGTANWSGFTPGLGPNGISMTNGGFGTSVLYSMANSSGAAPTNGWTYGSWSVAWVPVQYNSASNDVFGICSAVGNQDCFEFDFFADVPVGGAWSGYGFDVSQPASCALGSACTYTVSLLKSVAGVRTVLANGSISLATSSSFVAYSTMSVTRTPGGYMTVWLGTTSVVSAADSSAGIKKSNLSSLSINLRTGTPSAESAIMNVSLNGYGFGTLVSRIVDTGAGAPLAGVMSSSYTLTADGATQLAFYVRDSTSPNNDLWSSWQASSNAVLAVLPLRYWQYEAIFNTTVASETPKLTSFELGGVTTGYYYSKVNFVGSLITSWRQFGVTENTPGVYNYAVREATYNFSPSATTPAWIAQTANQNVNLSVSTPTYAQFRLDSTSLVSNVQGASAAEPVTAVFLRWNQGANLPASSATLERRYILCVTVSTSAAASDTCLMRQKTGKWVQWSNGGTIGAMGIYNYNMIAADGGTSSKVWQIMQPNVYQDDGSAISATWTSSDFTAGVPFNRKIFHEAWVDALPVQGSSVTFSYSTAKSGAFISQTFSTDNGQSLDLTKPVVGAQLGSINKWLEPVSGYDTGKYISVQFSDNTFANYFRVNDYLLYVEDVGRETP